MAGDPMITAHELAIHRGLQEAEVITPAEYASVGLPFMGNCAGCQAVYGARKIHPSKSGKLMCSKCILGQGFKTCQEANEAIFGVNETEETLAALERLKKFFPNAEVISE